MSHPLVSIIIPTFNRAHLIGETLDSIIAQTYTNWECIIVDDGSSDNTEQIVLEYVKNDSRFQYHKRPDTYQPGGNGARNYGFTLSRGEYINWFDSDDLMVSSFLEKHINQFKGNVFLNLSVSYANIFKHTKTNITGSIIPTLKQVTNNPTKSLILGELFFSTPCSVWQKSFLQNKDLFNEKMLRAQEAEFNFKRSTENLIYLFIPESLVLVRRGHDSIDSQSNKDYKKIQSQFDYFNTVFMCLNSKKILEKKESEVLKKYCLFRKLIFFSNIRNLTGLFKKNNIKNTKILISSTIQINSRFFDKLKILMGVLLVLITNKGYKYIYIKEFNYRKH